MNPSDIFKFRKLNWQDYYRSYTTPRDWKKGARDIPFGQGTRSLYVDGANGHDHNDGESWKTAFKTIQGALDTAESWTTIFINPGTYSEYVEITQNNISLIGASSDSVIITRGSYPTVIQINGNFCSLSNLKILIPEGNVDWGIMVDHADHFSVDACLFERVDVANYGISLNGSHSAVVSNCVFSDSWDGIFMSEEVDISRFCSIYNNFFSSNGGTAVALHTGFNCLVFNNNFSDCGKGVNCTLDSGYNSIFHNNFFNSPLRSSSTNDHFFENFYDTHSNIDNGFGIATEPYYSLGALDPRPVVCSNGWHGVSCRLAGAEAEGTATLLDAFAGTATSGETGADVLTIPTTARKKTHFLGVQISGLTADANATIRMYTKILDADTSLTKFYAQSFIVGTDTPFVPVIDGTLAIRNDIRVEIQSSNAGDTSVSVKYNYIMEAAE